MVKAHPPTPCLRCMPIFSVAVSQNLGYCGKRCSLSFKEGWTPIGCQPECELLCTHLPLHPTHTIPACPSAHQPLPQLCPTVLLSIQRATVGQLALPWTEAVSDWVPRIRGTPSPSVSKLSTCFPSVTLHPFLEPSQVVIPSPKPPIHLCLLDTQKITLLLTLQRREMRTAPRIYSFSSPSSFLALSETPSWIPFTSTHLPRGFLKPPS